MDSQSSGFTAEETKCSSSTTGSSSNNSSEALSVSFHDEVMVREIPCVLRQGERLLLKGATTQTNPIMDYDKSRLWFSARELQVTKRQAQRDVEYLLSGRVSIDGDGLLLLDEGSGRLTTTADASSLTQQETSRICVRGLELLSTPSYDGRISARVTYVDEVLIQQSRQRADRIDDVEAIANAGRLYSKVSRQEAIDRARDDYLEAVRIHALPCYEPPQRPSSLQQARLFLRRTSKGLQKRLSFPAKKKTTDVSYAN